MVTWRLMSVRVRQKPSSSVTARCGTCAIGSRRGDCARADAASVTATSSTRPTMSPRGACRARSERSTRVKSSGSGASTRIGGGGWKGQPPCVQHLPHRPVGPTGLTIDLLADQRMPQRLHVQSNLVLPAGLEKTASTECRVLEALADDVMGHGAARPTPRPRASRRRPLAYTCDTAASTVPPSRSGMP